MNKLTANVSYTKGKSLIWLYVNALNMKVGQFDRYNEVSYQRYFTNINPSIFFKYYYPEKALLQLRLNRDVVRPTLTQLQPIEVNEDALNITVGNPALRMAFSNRISGSYILINRLKEQNLIFSGAYTLLERAIISNMFTDAAGKTIYSFSNLNTKHIPSFNIDIQYTKRIKKINLSTSTKLGFMANRTYGLSNNQLYQRTDKVFNLNLSFYRYIEEKYNFDFSIKPSYTLSVSSLNNYLDNSGFGYTSDATAGFSFFKNMQLNLGYDYTFYAKSKAFNTANSVFLLNSSLSKKLLKQQNLKLSVMARDLLNQNKGFRRSTFGTIIAQDSYTTIKRHVLFSLSWDFSKFGKYLPRPIK
jgi:hypothetical protein